MSYTPMPYDILEWHKWGRLLNHVAIVLPFEGEPWVYEAFPPRVRRMPYEEHAAKWLFSSSTRIVYRNTSLTLQQQAAMSQRLIQLVGKHYGWIPNYVFKLPWEWHCIEFVCEGQVAAFGQVYDRNLSRVGPVLWRRVTIELGWPEYRRD